MRNESPRAVFIRYNWDSEDHKKWVKSFAFKQSQAGIYI